VVRLIRLPAGRAKEGREILQARLALCLALHHGAMTRPWHDTAPRALKCGRFASTHDCE
jgi:hypothetical protein